MRAPAILRAAASLSTALLVSAGQASAATAKIWTSDSSADLSAGEARGVAVTVKGELVLSRGLARVEGVNEAVLYDAVTGPEGVVYVGTGEAGRILRISPAGKVDTYATLAEKQVTALVLGPDGALYAGASPGGKVYRLDAGKPSLYYDTKAQYVWALEFSGSALYVATGLPAEIHRVDASGRGWRVHQAADAHVRALHAVNGDVWAGTAGSGLVLKVDPAGNVTTVFDSGKTEVTAIASGGNGRVWAAASSSEGAGGGGEPISAPLPPPTKPAARPGAPGEDQPREKDKPEVSVTVSTPRLAPARPPSRSGYTSEVILFEKGEPPRVVWTGSDEIIFDLGDADATSVLVATGPKGRLYRVSADTWSLERTFDEKQVSIVAGEAIATNGASAFYRLKNGARSGEYVSAVKDTGRTSTFGAFRYEGEVPAGSKLEVAFRSGESSAPDTTWSGWSELHDAAGAVKVDASPGRYLQWKLRMASANGETPTIRRIEAAYRNRNAAPVIEAFFAMGPNEVFARSGGTGSNVLEATAPDEKGIFTSLEEARPESAPRKLMRKGFRTLTWKTSDSDGDTVAHSLEFRPLSTSHWVPLKADVRESFFSFDTTALPDGEYVFRLTASDAEANPEDPKSSSRETTPVWIDNTPPVLKRVDAGRGALRIEVTDAASPVTDFEYSVNAREWVRVEPEDGLSDSRKETYSIELAPGERGGYLLVRATDAARNTAAMSLNAP
ncbi:MAG TPA: hypothetical protein VGS98_10695 [Thermoanaerobaculia bacterium]|nr:hypothetical protein [Thermoanaerobaculia bacterium]